MHVQFYAQPWAIGRFAGLPSNPNVFAPAIYLGEGTDAAGNQLTPVPAYCGGAGGGGDPCLDSSVRNWEYAYANWDTSKNGVTANSTWKFWVVAWVELNGKSAVFLQEIPGHGLASMPDGQFNSLADVPIEPYSNNLGYYNQVFTVLGAGVTEVASAKSQIPPFLILSNLGPRGTALRDHAVKISAKLRSSGRDIAEAHMFYYDGDPNQNGVLFDIQKVDRIPFKDGVVDTASFTPKTCGPHWIYVQAVPLDRGVRGMTMTTNVRVTVDPLPQVEGLIKYVSEMNVSPGVTADLAGSSSGCAAGLSERSACAGQDPGGDVQDCCADSSE